MDIQTRKLLFIQQILSVSNEKILENLEALLKIEQEELDQVLKEKLTCRALSANENINQGKTYSRQEAEEQLKQRMGR